MKIQFIFAPSILISLVLAGSASAACPEFKLPEKFEADEKFFAIGTDIALEAGGKRFGAIEQRVLKLTPTFDLFDANEKKVARGRQRIFSWGTTIDVTDCEGKAIGSVKENIWKSLFKFTTQYEVMDAAGKTVALSDKKEFFSTKFLFKSVSGTELSKMHRPTFNWLTDTWKVQVLSAGGVDPRIAVLVPAFKTAADNRRRAAEAIESASSN